MVEELKECPLGDDGALADTLKQLQPKKGQGGYLHAVCGVYPAKRLVRRATIEPRRVKEAGYLNDTAATQFRIEPDKYTLAMVTATEGLDYDVSKTPGKEVVFCGLPTEDIAVLQESILAKGIYPTRLELGTVATVGALADYLNFSKSKTPTLVLELGMNSTHSFIVSTGGLDASRPIPQGLDSMIPVVQKELGLKDEESARKLFFSNTFDFTGMGPALIKKLLKELQSSIGFYEVQTGQSIGQVMCTHLPPKLGWLENSIAGQLGVGVLKLDLVSWLQARQITLSDEASATPFDGRWLGLFSLMAQYHAAVSDKK
ncbi:MAG TPA: hypothetical protein VGD81_14935 [Opitutaceae bacterium]